jgi:hemolysin-activating ACP:hemolysin acyltransferase
MKTSNNQPITFAEWAFVKGSLVQRRDFTYEQLVSTKESKNKQQTIFGDFIEKPIKTYPLTHYLKLKENEL